MSVDTFRNSPRYAADIKRFCTSLRAFMKVMFPHAFTLPESPIHAEFDKLATDTTLKHGVIEVFRESGKCLAAGTEVLMSDGTRKLIEDIAVGDYILSYDVGAGCFATSDMIVGKVHSGPKRCLRVTTASGKRVTLTPEHKVLTFDGWKIAGELTLKDRIASPRQSERYMPPLSDSSVSDEEVRLLAYMIAEGNTTTYAQKDKARLTQDGNPRKRSTNCTFTNTDSVIREDFCRCAEAMGFRVRKRNKTAFGLSAPQGTPRKDGPRTWARKHGLAGKMAPEKRVPEWVFRLGRRKTWMFLAAMIDTDGWVTTAKAEVGITLASEGLIDDLMYLFMSVGVVTKKRKRSNKFAGAWDLTIDKSYLFRAAQRLPLLLKKERVRVAAEKTSHGLLDTYPQKIARMRTKTWGAYRRAGVPIAANKVHAITRPKMQAMLAFDRVPEWEHLEQAGVFWDRIKKIEAVGIRDTYDVQVLCNKNLVTNGLVTHNSTFFAIGLPLWHRFCEPIVRWVQADGDWPATFNEVQAILRRTESATFTVVRSKSLKEAKRRLRAVGLILGSPVHRSMKQEVIQGRRTFALYFGDWSTMFESATQEELRMRDGSVWTAMGADQQGHGLQEDFLRITLALNDDPETEKNTRTLATMENNLDTFMNGLYAGLAPRGRAYSLGTPIVEGCQIRVLRDLAATMPRWQYRHYPLLVPDADAGPHGYRSVWPEKYGVDEVLAEKDAMAAQGKVYLWYQKYQCEIRGRENQLFTEQDIMLYRGGLKRGRSGEWFLEITHTGSYAHRAQGAPFPLVVPETVPVNLFAGHDPASGVGGDEAVYLVRAYDATGKTAWDGRHFVVDYTASNTASVPTQCQWVLDDYDKRRPKATCVEGAFFDESMQTVMQTETSVRGAYPNITKITPRMGKGKRYMQEVQGAFKGHRVFVRPEHTALIDEALTFNITRKDNKDDHLDGFWLSTKENWPPSHTLSDLGPAPPAATPHETYLAYAQGTFASRRTGALNNDWQTS